MVLLNEHHYVVPDRVLTASPVLMPLPKLLLSDSEVVSNLDASIGKEHGIELSSALDGSADAVVHVVGVVGGDAADQKWRILESDMLGNEEHLVVAELQNQVLSEELPQLRVVHFQRDCHHKYEFGSYCSAIIVDVHHFFKKRSGVYWNIICIFVSFVGEGRAFESGLVEEGFAGPAFLFQFHFDINKCYLILIC